MGAWPTSGQGRPIQSCSSTGKNTLPNCRTTLMEIVAVWDSLRTWRKSLAWSLLTKNTRLKSSQLSLKLKQYQLRIGRWLTSALLEVTRIRDGDLPNRLEPSAWYFQVERLG